LLPLLLLFAISSHTQQTLYQQGILLTLLSCLPPSKGVLRKATKIS
jgi:hypothetical protein